MSRLSAQISLIVLVGGVLRFIGITKGLPDLYVHDEIIEVHRALNLLQGDYQFNRVGKGFFFFIIAVEYFVLAMFEIALGRFNSLTEFVSQSMVHPGTAIFLGRITSALMGTISVYFMYLIGRSVFTEDKKRIFSGSGFYLGNLSTCRMAI